MTNADVFWTYNNNMIVYNKEFNEQIRKICTENPTSYYNVFTGRKYSYLKDYVESCVKGFLDDKNSKFSKKINWVLNEYQDFPKCKNKDCNNKVIGSRQIRFSDKWPEHCCNTCAQKDNDTISKVRRTKKEHFGNENYNGSIEDLKKKNLEKYGCEWYVQSDEFKNKKLETWRSHGYDHPMHSEQVKRGMMERYEEKHGVRYSTLDPDVMKKARKPYAFDGVYFKSSWELAYYIYLKDNGVEFEYQPEMSLKYEDGKGVQRFYFPDFKVNGKLVEIKGDQFINDNGEYRNPYDREGATNHIYEAKRKCMQDNGVEIMSACEIRPYVEYCRKKYGNYDWQLRFKANAGELSMSIERNDGNLMKEFRYYSKCETRRIPVNHGTRNYIIKYFQQDTFFKKEKELLQDEKIREQLIENRRRFLNREHLTSDDILTGFKKSGIYYGYSHFNPLWFKWFIKRYAVKSCYDPCGGWGHRLLGGLCLEKYIYNDISVATKRNVDRMIEYFGISNTATYGNDARSFVPDERFDAMFTCPPYFNVEHYECGDFKDIDDYNDFMLKLYGIYKNTESCKIFGLVIRDDLLPKRMNEFDEKIDIISYGKSYLSNKENTNREHMYIYRKRDRND